ncbi:MAG: 4-(cytidine 5'-diphospho)-2-C-methyl-D-erythritol kinase [Actinomycetota bacterium]
MLPSSASLFAPAKLTIDLRVTGVRADGMHLIDAEMVTLDFGDDLALAPGEGVRYSGAWQGEAGDGDLVSRALAILGERRKVDVTKRIPAGAGLGGGSADAAAILRAGGFDDLHAAAQLGADVAFCLVGGRARVSGIGEIIEPLPHVERSFTLMTPPLHCSTPEVYRAWDALGGPTGDNGNDLEPAALTVVPELARWRDRLSEHAGTLARLAGSGATWFVEGTYPGEGYVVARTRPADAVA